MPPRAVLRQAAVVLLIASSSAGCASTQADRTSAAPATQSAQSLQVYLEAGGRSLHEDRYLGTVILESEQSNLARSAQVVRAYAVDVGSSPDVVVYEFESEAARAAALRRTPVGGGRSRFENRSTYAGGHLVVVYTGRDVGVEGDLGRVLDVVSVFRPEVRGPAAGRSR